MKDIINMSYLSNKLSMIASQEAKVTNYHLYVGADLSLSKAKQTMKSQKSIYGVSKKLMYQMIVFNLKFTHYLIF